MVEVVFGGTVCSLWHHLAFPSLVLGKAFSLLSRPGELEHILVLNRKLYLSLQLGPLKQVSSQGCHHHLTCMSSRLPGSTSKNIFSVYVRLN